MRNKIRKKLLQVGTEFDPGVHYYAAQDSRELYFRSDKDKITLYVYDIKILKQLLSDEIFVDLLFGHVFFYCHTTSILIKQVIVYRFVCLFICSAMDGQTARPNGLKFGG